MRRRAYIRGTRPPNDPQRGERRKIKPPSYEREKTKTKNKNKARQTQKKEKTKTERGKTRKRVHENRGERAPIFVAAERPKIGDTHTAAQQRERRQSKRLQKGSTAATILSKVCSLIIASSKKRA